MPFAEFVQNFNEVNMYQIHADEIQQRVSQAMLLEGAERDQALKQVMMDLFPEDSRGYERVRQEGLQYVADHMGEEDDFVEQYHGMLRPVSYIQGYADVIIACAKDIDPQYEPKHMLGITREEAKRLLNDSLNSYTLHDAAYHALFHGRGIEACREDLKLALHGRRSNEINHYHEAPSKKRKYEDLNYAKAYIEDAYIHKEILKSELDKKNFFWKMLHPIQAYSMYSFVKSAEKVLRKVGFTQEDGVDVRQRYNSSATSEEEIGWVIQEIDREYNAEEKKQAEQNVKEKLSVVDGDKDVNVQKSKPIEQKAPAANNTLVK